MSATPVIPIDRDRLQDSYRVVPPEPPTNIESGASTWTRKQPESVGRKILWEELYPVDEVADPKVIAAQRLLAEAIKAFESAFKEADEDVVAADDYVQSAQPLLAELFACRSVGEGFAAIINALSISLVNQHGEPISKKQIGLIARSLRELKSQLFLSYDSGLRLLREFKKSGLRIYPEVLQNLDLQHE